MKIFHLFYNLIFITFLDKVCSSGTTDHNISLDQKGNEIFKKFFKTKEFCNFSILMEEINGMVEEIETNINIEKSLNDELIKTSKSLMDNSTTIKSLSDRNTIIKCNNMSIELCEKFIPLYTEKKDKDRTMIFSFLIEKFVFKLNEMKKSIKKVQKKRHLNLPRFKSLKENLNKLKEKCAKINYNYGKYSELLGENVAFYDSMLKMLEKLSTMFKQTKNDIFKLADKILKKENLYYAILVTGNFGRLYDCYKKDNKRLNFIYMHLKDVWDITESLMSLNDEISD